LGVLTQQLCKDPEFMNSEVPNRTVGTLLRWMVCIYSMLQDSEIFTTQLMLPLESMNSEYTRIQSTIQVFLRMEVKDGLQISALREFSTQNKIQPNSFGVLYFWTPRSIDTWPFVPMARIRSRLQNFGNSAHLCNYPPTLLNCRTSKLCWIYGHMSSPMDGPDLL
jgi:hypothetical protein